jgi:hypothetical protein
MHSDSLSEFQVVERQAKAADLKDDIASYELADHPPLTPQALQEALAATGGSGGSSGSSTGDPLLAQLLGRSEAARAALAGLGTHQGQLADDPSSSLNEVGGWGYWCWFS